MSPHGDQWDIPPWIVIDILYTYSDMKQDQATNIFHIIIYSRIIYNNVLSFVIVCSSPFSYLDMFIVYR